MATKKKKTECFAIIANERYGLYAGIVVSHDTKTKVVQARDVRHVAYWYGKTGGITSLAVHGLCGPKASQSRIGAPAKNATLTGVVNVFECTPEARATIEAATQS
jgi:hypothetical protein